MSDQTSDQLVKAIARIRAERGTAEVHGLMGGTAT